MNKRIIRKNSILERGIILLGVASFSFFLVGACLDSVPHGESKHDDLLVHEEVVSFEQEGGSHGSCSVLSLEEDIIRQKDVNHFSSDKTKSLTFNSSFIQSSRKLPNNNTFKSIDIYTEPYWSFETINLFPLPRSNLI